MNRANRINFLSSQETHDLAVTSLKRTGDAALVIRGLPRMLVLRCPCGCGDDLTINLDHRSGRAWKHYIRRGQLTLYPSYWRDTHCECHFILWNNEILWCDWKYDSYWAGHSDLEERVYAAISSEYVSYVNVADELGEIPWEVLKSCNALVRKKRISQHPDRRSGMFRRNN